MCNQFRATVSLLDYQIVSLLLSPYNANCKRRVVTGSTRVLNEDVGKYPGTRYDKVQHIAEVHSCFRISRAGRTIWLSYDYCPPIFKDCSCQDCYYVRQEYALTAPKGWRWADDELGLKLCRADNREVDYHPSVVEWYKARLRPEELVRWANLASSSHQIRLQEISQDDIARLAPLIKVTAGDAYRVGNCAAGVRRFIELNFPEKAGQFRVDPYVGVTADKLLTVGSSRLQGGWRARQAVIAAISRQAFMSGAGI